MELKKVGFYLQDLMRKGYLLDDVFSSSKIITACATDLRMDGHAMPVMSSGESGNQGIVAILVRPGTWPRPSECRTGPRCAPSPFPTS